MQPYQHQPYQYQQIFTSQPGAGRPPRPLPAEAYREAEVYHLGEPLMRITESFLAGFCLTLTFLPGTLGLIVAAFLTWPQAQMEGNLPILIGIFSFLTLLFSLLAFVGLQSVLSLLFGTHERTYACAYGFLTMKGRRRVTRVVRWDEIWNIASTHKGDTEAAENQSYWFTTRAGVKIDVGYKLWQHICTQFKQLHPDHESFVETTSENVLVSHIRVKNND